jgi:hypothetical protein
MERNLAVYATTRDDRQPSQDYEMGFWSGAIHGYLTRRRMLSQLEQELKAFEYFMREAKLGATWIGAFVQGWLAGYQSYFDGIV